MRLPQSLFYGFATLCLGLIAVASGGVRALVVTIGFQDLDYADRLGVVLTVAVALAVTLLGFVAAATPDRRDPGDDDTG